MRILFVCTGNTCRSPMAAHLGQERWAERGEDVEVRSAGLSASPGAEASPHARFVVHAHGGSLEEHRSRALAPDLLDWADLVLTMTRAHREAVRAMAPDDLEVRTLAEFAGRADEDVADPFGGDAEDYESAYAQIDELITAAAGEIHRRRRNPRH